MFITFSSRIKKSSAVIAHSRTLPPNLDRQAGRLRAHFSDTRHRSVKVVYAIAIRLLKTFLHKVSFVTFRWKQHFWYCKDKNKPSVTQVTTRRFEICSQWNVLFLIKYQTNKKITIHGIVTFMLTTMSTMLFYWIVCVYFLQKQNLLNFFRKLCRPYCAALSISHELTRTRPTPAALGYKMATKKFFALIAEIFVNDFDPKWSVFNDCDWEWLLFFLLMNFLINKKTCQTTIWSVTTMKWSVVTLSKRHFWNPRKKIKKLPERWQLGRC